ncbi:hypothetical protein RRG08_019537 [Elysia crispata]|uniref:Uncharacterized protein n=1 Tax=Elysia crispata TaxID=231223 RepID=A0AAE1D617_9GAST|nr:hypothetical protein RRG08_019537 [Elysia crispata]
MGYLHRNKEKVEVKKNRTVFKIHQSSNTSRALDVYGLVDFTLEMATHCLTGLSISQSHRADGETVEQPVKGLCGTFASVLSHSHL